MRPILAIACALTLSLPALAAVTVSDVKIQQRWPWNGLVDIDYTVTCDTPDADIYVYPTALDGDRRIAIAPRTLTGAGATGPVKAGTHRMTWDLAADNPGLHSSAFTVTIHAYAGAAPYMVLDLSAGAEATHYPVTYHSACPDLTDDAYRTTKMVFKLVIPGTFMMGSPSTEAGRTDNEDLHQVTLTQPFYMAIYECTRQQWAQVTGKLPDNWSNNRLNGPAQYVSWEDIRGSVAALTWPATEQVDNDSFMGKLRMRTGQTFDLPTEAQWEYACRAGTSTPWSTGDDASKINGSFNNRWDIKVVGSYAPNAWGFYDMHGNVQEWCVDAAYTRLGTEPATDPKGSSGDYSRLVRGGYNQSKAVDVRSARRDWLKRARTDSSTGFRVICRPGVK